MRWADAKARLGELARRAAPITGAAERVAKLAVQMHNGITPIGAVGMLSSVVNAISEAGNVPCSAPGYGVLVSRNTMTEALVAAGWEVKGITDETTELVQGTAWVKVYATGVVGKDAAAVAAFSAALDVALPAWLKVARSNHASGDSYTDTAVDQHHYETATGAAIAAALQLHLPDGPRCVLLDGKPGTGKTMMAREIAARLAAAVPGRVLFLDASMFERHLDAAMLRQLRPAVIVVDDIDKIRLDLTALEAMREVARVVMLTSNNGDQDAVLDGALIRPGRIDEVFTVEAVTYPRAAPFDLLTDEEWSQAQGWPIAYSTELGRRLTLRGRDGMRFEELAKRVARRTRSGALLG